MEPWAAALEKLIERSGQSKRHIDRQRLAGREQFLRWKSAKRGPAISIVDRILKGLGLTWSDWAEAYAEVTGEKRARKPGQILHIAEKDQHYGLIDDHVMIPKLDVKLAAGGGGSGTERIERSYAFDRSWIKATLKANPAELRLVDVTGHSMDPTYCKGNMVMVDLGRRKIHHDLIYAIRTADGPIIKRLCKQGKTWHLHSDNPDKKQYPDQPIEIEELEIIGEVLWGAGRRT